MVILSSFASTQAACASFYILCGQWCYMMYCRCISLSDYTCFVLICVYICVYPWLTALVVTFTIFLSFHKNMCLCVFSPNYVLIVFLVMDQTSNIPVSSKLFGRKLMCYLIFSSFSFLVLHALVFVGGFFFSFCGGRCVCLYELGPTSHRPI